MMKFWKSIIIVALLVEIAGCANQKLRENFFKDGVSFTCPSDWSVTKQEDLDGTGYYLSVEKRGLNASGLLTITWINVVTDSHDYLETIQEEFKNQKLLNDLEFQSARDNSFNGIQSISSDFKFSTLGLKFRGVIHIFIKGENTYSIVKQEAIEDISKNKKGFKLIETTFKVE